MTRKCCGYEGEPCWDCPEVQDPEFKPVFPRDDYDRAEIEYDRMEEDEPSHYEKWIDG